MNYSPYRVIVLGNTKSGKSSILNSLTHSKYFDSHIHEEIKYFTEKFKGRFASPDITFIDTPGFTDCGIKDNEVILKVNKTLVSLDNGLNWILFCFSAYEIRCESSMKAGWKYLSLVLANAKYEHISIILTHGSCLTSQELEEAIVRMTTEFIPYIKDTLKYKVKDEILIYKNKGIEDGLNGVLEYITLNKGYRSSIIEDLRKFWMPEDPLGSIEYLLQNAKIFNQLQDLILNTKENHKELEEEVNTLKSQITSLEFEKNKEMKEEIEKVILGYQETIKQEVNSFESYKSEIDDKLKQMREEINNKDKKIEILTKQIEDLKVNKKESISTGVGNQGLQLDIKKYQVKAERNYIDHSAKLPGNYHIAPAAKKYSDNHSTKATESITSQRGSVAESKEQIAESYQRVYECDTSTLSKKAPANVQQSLGMKWMPIKIPSNSQQSLDMEDSKIISIPQRPAEKSFYKYVGNAYSQQKFVYATPQIKSKKFETNYRQMEYVS